MSNVLTALLVCLSVLSAARQTVAQDLPPAGPKYVVDLTQAISHYVTITMEADSTGPETQIMMATWTPGSYLVREYARNIDRISAADSGGNDLSIEKINKNRWSIKTGDSKTFKITYRIYCNESSVRTNSVGVNSAVLTGAATFITVPDQLDRPHVVTLTLPKGWTESSTSLPAVGEEPHHYRAENFDELVDSPIVAGNVVTFPFEVAGIKHYLVNVNQSANWDGEKAVKDLAKIIAEHHKVWGVVPYDRYYFLNIFSGGGGGLEHDNCCLIMTSKFEVRDESSYLKWLGLASHEFFHAWNVRRVRPKSLVKYDYEAETYTPSLWIAEGITSYYEDLLVARAGLLTQKKFLDGLGATIAGVQRTDGRNVQSLRDASHDAWIKFYRPSPNSSDTQISYYTKGAVVGFLLDAKIRSVTKGQKSLDDVLKAFYQKYSGGVGYEPQDFQNLCSETAGEDLSEWFRAAVDSTSELDYQVPADWFGLEIGDFKPFVVAGEQTNVDETKSAEPAGASIPEAAKVKQEGEAKKENEKPKKPASWIGVGKPDSPATRAGLADSDEIIAVNGKRVSSGVDSELQNYEVGEPVKILIARNGELKEILLVIGSRPPAPTWSLTESKLATPDQKSRLASWLNQPLDKAAEKKPDEKPDATAAEQGKK